MTLTALDLFCCAGGASRGLVNAGFLPMGIDISKQPRYPYLFRQADAMAYPETDASPNPDLLPPMTHFDLVWASPPCQTHTAGAKQALSQLTHPDLIAPMREKLLLSQKLYIMENVPGAPLLNPIKLNGNQFGLNTYRERWFETNFWVPQLAMGSPFGPASRPGSVTVAGHTGGYSVRNRVFKGNKRDWELAMGIDWMNAKELVEAIPPCYAEFLAHYAFQALIKRRTPALVPK